MSQKTELLTTEEERFIAALYNHDIGDKRLTVPAGKPLADTEPQEPNVPAIERIELDDYLKRTLASAVEYVFYYLLRKKDRNFTLWQTEEWISFFRKMISLYRELIKQSGVSYQEVYQIFYEQLPAKMIEALKHALENDLITALDLTFDLERALDDEDYLTCFLTEYESNVDEAKQKCLAGLEDSVHQHLQRGFAFCSRDYFVGLLKHFSGERWREDQQSNQPNFADDSREKNEMMVQVTVMTKRIADRIAKLLEFDVVSVSVLADMFDDFSDGQEDCLTRFWDKKPAFEHSLQAVYASQYEKVAELVRELSLIFIELNKWPILVRTPFYKFQIVGGIANMFNTLIRQVSTSDKGDNGDQSRASNFVQAFNAILADSVELEKRVFSSK